jgi:subtilisin
VENPVSCLSEFNDFDHNEFLSNPEPEPFFAASADDPICTIPPDHVFHGLIDENTIQSLPWHFTQPSEEVWQSIWDKISPYIGGVVVGNLDTGCNPHDILPTPLAMESFISGQSAFDGNGHGTHTCSTSVANDKRHGVAPGAQLLVGKVLSNGGSGSSSGIADGNKWLGQWKGEDGLRCDVVNMSLGGGSRYAPTIEAIGINFQNGILTNCSAGNSGPREGTEGYPARDPSVPSIGATQQNGQIANFSSRGDILVACPGQQIAGASYRSRTAIASMSGTSMSCPFKSGLDAIVIALRRASGLPRWRSVQPVFDLYKAYSEDRGRPGKDTSFGHGVPAYQRLVEDLSKFGKDLFIKAL